MAIMESPGAASLTTDGRHDNGAPVLSIVIVSFNCKQYLLDCLRSVYDASPRFPFEVIVVDNASSDGSCAAIAEAFPQATLVRRDANAGFGRGCNVGAERATGKFLLFLNPDTLVRPGAIERLVNFANDRPEAGIWGGRTVSESGESLPGSCWRFPSLWSTFCVVAGLARAFPDSAIFNSEAYGGWQRDSVRRVDVVSGCLLLIDRDLWRRLGGFDPTYFLYSEEVDLCLRARGLGASPVISPDVEIVHHGGKTQTIRSERLIRMLTGKRTYMLQHWSGARQWLGAALLLSWPLSRYLTLMVSRDFFGRSSAAAAAETWGEVWVRRRDWLAGYAREARS